MDGDRASCSKIPNSSRTNSTDGSQPHERPTRPNAVKRLSDAISFASARASIVCSPLIRKAFSSLDELRERMPNLRRREQADNAELQAIVDQSVDRAAYLRLAETLTTFLTRLRSSAGALDVSERQRLMRLLVKEILVGDDEIIIRHCIPVPMGPVNGPASRCGRCLAQRSRLSFAFEEPLEHFTIRLTISGVDEICGTLAW